MNIKHTDSSSTGVIGDKGMVATGHPLAAQAAIEILNAGGSAVDAAIAADAILGVVEPMATGIGGDVLAMVVPVDGHPESYNGTGRSPNSLSIDAINTLADQKIPERHPLSVTTPGVVRGWFDLHQKYGRLGWRQLFKRAIEAASDGFLVAPVAAREWRLFEGVIRKDPVAANLYSAGRVPVAGERFTNPELASILRSIANDGVDAFYLGKAAIATEKALSHIGGLLTAEDFSAHTGNFCEPVSANYRGLTVLECPPNTHGVAVLHALTELDTYELGRDDPAATLTIVQAMGRAMEHAKKTVADPAGNTVCTVVVDQSGLAITLMSSIFKRFGSGIAVPGCGFVLQNRGFGFSTPGHINGPGPSKRPYHTVVPGAALKDGRFHAAFGVVGGAMQPQGHVQLLIRLKTWGQPLQDAIDAPRWRLEGQRALALETGTSDAVRDAMRKAGYTEPQGLGELGGRSDFGGAQVVLRGAEGCLCGGSDKRKDGLAQAQ